MTEDQRVIDLDEYMTLLRSKGYDTSEAEAYLESLLVKGEAR